MSRRLVHIPLSRALAMVLLVTACSTPPEPTVTAPPATRVPAAGSSPEGSTANPVGPGPVLTITMDICQNQHGQGVAEGLIRNNDSVIHAYRVVVAFSDPEGILLTTTDGLTPETPPGITARWQAVVPSGLPSVSVACQVTNVLTVR